MLPARCRLACQCQLSLVWLEKWLSEPEYESYATLLMSNVVYWKVEHFFAFSELFEDSKTIL
jgi:hypothetical protein